MSFSRAKLSRFNDHEKKSVKQPLQSENMNKAGDKPQRTPLSSARHAVSKPLTKPRSLSQPSSNTTVSKQISRPHSGGDEKKLIVNKTNLGEFAVSEEHSDDEQFESATMLKASSTDQLGEHNKSDSPQSSPADSDQKSPTCKASSSGIPLRVKQQQQQQSAAKPPITTPKKASPRVVKPTSNATHRGGSPTKADAKSEPSPRGLSPLQQRNLEALFHSKKKKIDQLKKEISDRQKPLLETYQGLMQIKKKLEGCGKIASLENFKLENYVPPSPQGTKVNLLGSGESDITKKVKIDPEMVKNMKQTIKRVPMALLEICRNLMIKRSTLVDFLGKMASEPLNQEQINQNVESLKEESGKLENLIEDTLEKHEKDVTDLVNKWQVLLNSSGDYSKFAEQIELLQENIRQKEQRLTEMSAEQQEELLKSHDSNAASEKIISDLKDKIKTMEQELHREKILNQDQKDKVNLSDQKMKVLKTRIKELETKLKEIESKYTDAQKGQRCAQEQLRANEHRWAKEKEEMVTKHKNDRQMLEKLTKDRSFFETRVKTLEEMVEDKEKKHKIMEEELRNEVEEARKAAAEDKMQRESMQQKFDSIKDQLIKMEIRNKQAIDIVHSKNTFEPSETEGITTEREAELYTELLATRVALKAAEDQIQNYNREKLRFIDSIQSLQGDPEKDKEYVAKTMIKNVEKITGLESKLAESEETICNQKIEIANLKVDIENLQQRAPLASTKEHDGKVDKDTDLKLMLHEGRIKLEQSLKKSLEYEHKIIRYEHDINRQSKQICEMENLLKVRDGLISMMKAKKDELQMENDSLNKYANEIRDLLIQSKEEARSRTEVVQELSTNLESRARICQQLEKKVKELEGSLSVTNEKRFKLQDTIGVMEKELQSTKAHINRLAPDGQSRTRFKSYKKW